MVIVDIRNGRALIRLLTSALVLVCLLVMPTLVSAEPPTPEEELADITAELREILGEIRETNDYTHKMLDKFSDDISANRDDISRFRLELSGKIDTSSEADRRDMSQLREEISRLSSKLSGEIAENRGESREDISELSSRVAENRRESREDISKLMDRSNVQFLWLLATIIGMPTLMTLLQRFYFRPKQESTGD